MDTRQIGICAVLLAVTAPLAPVARADVLSLTSSRDTTLYQDPAGLLSNGAGSAMFAGRNSAASNSIRRALVYFDLSAIPSGSTITAASLRLRNSASNVAPSDVSLHAATRSWGEAGSIALGSQGQGIAAQPGDSTWLHSSFSDQLWTSPGGDFNPIAVATTAVADAGTYTWQSAGLTALIQSAVNGSGTNYGWLLKGDESVSSSAKRFATREEPDVSQRPTLTIEYTPIPNPAVGTVLLGAIICAGIRRRS